MVKFTSSIDHTVSKFDMQFCKPLRDSLLTNGGIVCYSESYYDTLRAMIGAENVYLDFETGSYDSSLDSLNPWKHCWIIGLGIAVDEGPAYYIPVDKENESKVYDTLFDIFTHRNCKQWINHNIKYDAHVLANNAGIIPPYNVKLVDTLTLAKLIDSDRFRYGLDDLSKDWLEIDIKPYEDALKPYTHHNNRRINKDYSQIPIDIIAPYACQDAITVRDLYKYIIKNLPEQCNYVRDIEIELTRILFDMERNGMRTDLETLQQTETVNTIKLLELEVRLEKITGQSFRPHVNSDCFDILCNFYGLPVLKFTNDKDGTKKQQYDASYEEAEESLEKDDKPCNASFDKFAIAAYLSHPTVVNSPNIKSVVEGIAEYRKINTFNNLFVKKYQEQISVHNDVYLLHPFYNQTVRTGRMACKHPNAQQLDKDAKELILPYIGHKFVSFDFSQIEYRTIAHYIESERLINAYNNDPDVDFHQFVADLIKEVTKLDGMTRQPAKTLNFGLSFGMGKKKLLKSLEGNIDLMASLLQEIGNRPDIQDKEKLFHNLAAQRAEKVYSTYHKLIPEIKRTSYKAQEVCAYRGYIFNLFGRRRHLPFAFAYRAFNTINQSSAADLMKERMVYIGKLVRNTEIKIVASVHDEILFSMPEKLAEDKRVLHTIANLLEHPNFPDDIEFSVPIRVSCGIGNNWKEANKSATVQVYDQAISEEEEFLRICNEI